MDQFFYSKFIREDSILLPEDEAHHVLCVIRKRLGEKITVVDGYGGFYEAIIENDNITNCTLQISHRKQNYGKQNHHIHVAIAPPKNHERIEWFVEKTIEIGIQEISFIVAKRSERNNVKLNRIYPGQLHL